MKKTFSLLLVVIVMMFGFASCNEAENPVQTDVKTIAEDGKTDVQKRTTERKNERNQTESTTANLPKTTLSFEEMEHHFGTIDEGDSVEHTFKFTNTGTEDLVIEKCKGSCGCTVPQCPTQPIPPGGTGEIPVKFNSKGKKNHQEKRVTITANTETTTVLKIIADVTPADSEEQAAK